MSLMLEKGSEIPQSRELRLEQGITHGTLEDQFFRQYSINSIESLLKNIRESELIVENERRKAAETIGEIILDKLKLQGYICGEDISLALNQFKELEIMGETYEHHDLEAESG